MFRSVARTRGALTAVGVYAAPPLGQSSGDVHTVLRSCICIRRGLQIRPRPLSSQHPGSILLFFPSFPFLLFSITERPGSSPGTYLLLCQTPCAPTSCPAGRSHTCSNSPSRQLPGRPPFFSHVADTEPGLPPCYGQPALLRVKSPRSVVCLAWDNSKCPTESRGFGCP